MNFRKVAHTLLHVTSPKIPFDPHQHLTIHMNASTEGLVEVFYKGKGKEQCLVDYSSSTQLPAETRQLIMELKALATVWAINHNRNTCSAGLL